MNENEWKATEPDETPATATSIPTEPVGAGLRPGDGGEAGSVPSAGPSRARWLFAAGAVLAIAAVTIGALALFGSPGTSAELQYLPGGSAIVYELRMDLPGDQMQRLGNLLAHFPGFRDQSTLADKIDSAFERLVESASDGQVDYLTRVKPWLGGPVFVAATADALDASGPEPTGMVVVATTNGAVACTDALVDRAVTHETYRGLDLTVTSDGAAACVLDDRRAIVGDPATVRAALDAKANGTGMDRDQAYADARTALGDDRLTTLYVDGRAVAARIAADAGSASGGLGDLQAMTAQIPDWAIIGVRAEDAALVVDAVAAPVEAPASSASLVPVPPAHPSVLAAKVPADTLAYVEVQGAGALLQNGLAELSAMPDLADSLQVLEGLGGANQLVGWIDDAAVAISVDGDQPRAALLLHGADGTGAVGTLRSVETVLGLAALGGGVTVDHSTVNGVSVTTVTVTDPGALLPAGSVPDLGSVDAQPVSFSLAATGGTLILAIGDGTMDAVLGVGAGSSLADDATFKAAMAASLPSSGFSLYVAMGSAVDLATAQLSADELATYRSDVEPYLAPFDALAMTTTSDGVATRSRFVLTVSQP